MIPFSTLRQISLLLLFLPSAAFAVDVTLEWDRNPESNIIGYRIYHGRIPGGSPQRIEVGSRTLTQGVLSGLPAGAVCYAWATALNASGLESEPLDALLFISGPIGGQETTIPLTLLRGLVGKGVLLTGARAASLLSPPPEAPAGNNFLTVSSHPRSQSLFTGDTTVLGVTAAAAGPVSWQWLHNGTPLPGADSPTLAIGPASPAEAGIYQARIIMGETEILTEPAVVSVWPRPTLTISPGPGRLNPEENGLEVLVSGGSLQPLSLEFSENLTDWSLLEAFQLDDQGTRTIPDLTKTARQRFYRLRAGE